MVAVASYFSFFRVVPSGFYSEPVLSGLVYTPIIRGCSAAGTNPQTNSIYQNGTERKATILAQGTDIVYDRAISHPCDMKATVESEARGASINIYEKWTGKGIANCICYSELGIRISSIPNGTYTVNAYRQWTEGDTFLILPKQVSVPNDKESCESSGGVWGNLGLSTQPGCNLPTSDANKACTDSKQCQGVCLILDDEYTGNCSGTYGGCNKCQENGGLCYEDSQIGWMCDRTITTSDGSAFCKNNNDCQDRCILPQENVTGKCSEWVYVFGCHAHVENGKVGGILCID